MKKSAKMLFLEDLENQKIMGRTLDTDACIEIARSYVDVPSAEALARTHIRQRMNRWLSEVRDKNGARVYVSSGEEYVHLDLDTDPSKVQKARSRIKSMRLGLQKTEKKVNKRYRALTGQITIEDMVDERKAQ